MREREAIAILAAEARDEAVCNWRAEIRAIKRRISEARAETGGALGRWFPFQDKGAGGYWNCGAGVHIGVATEAAERLAALTGKPVWFWFNDQLHTAGPK